MSQDFSVDVISPAWRTMEISTASCENTVTINGEEYIKKSDLPATYEESQHVCVICTNGWIFEGRGHRDDGGDWLLSEASVVRRWDNGLGIGGIADPEHYADYTLDAIGSLRVHGRAVISVISIRDE